MENTSSDTNREQQVVSTIETPAADTASPSQKKGRPTVTRIITNLPEKLPVLPSEIALIVAWWPALADVLLANDNDDQGPDTTSK